MGMTLEPRQTAADQVRALMLRKDSIEADIGRQLEILKANNCTMQTLLVDAEGFPRADIDIWEVRHARVRVIELRNDLTAIMDSIHKGLQGVYDPSLVLSSTEEEKPATSASGLDPFAKVDGVAPGSPAASAVSSVF
jgi:26S proteasome regulatory subunit N4